MKNILLTIEYDGTGFSGWQCQPGRRTVQGELERVLSTLCKQEITLQGTSRTDAGVHALAQRANFYGDFGIPVEKICVAANNLLAGEGRFAVGDLRIRESVEVKEDFHSRFSACGKKYIYKIRSAAQPDIMQRRYCYQIGKPLDLEAMSAGASCLIGEKDFRSFMAAGGKVPESTVRTIFSAKLKKEPVETKSSASRQPADFHDSLITFEIKGSGFLYNMVRIITGTLVDIGLGKIRPDEMNDIIASLDRSRAGHTAPPWGLYLAEVYFSKEDTENEE